MNNLSSARVKFTIRSGGQFWKVTGIPPMSDDAAHDLAWDAVLKEHPEADFVYSSVIPPGSTRPEPLFDKVIPYSGTTT